MPPKKVTISQEKPEDNEQQPPDQGDSTPESAESPFEEGMFDDAPEGDEDMEQFEEDRLITTAKQKRISADANPDAKLAQKIFHEIDRKGRDRAQVVADETRTDTKQNVLGSPGPDEEQGEQKEKTTKRGGKTLRRLNRDTMKHGNVIGEFGGARWSRQDPEDPNKQIYYGHDGVEIPMDDQGNPLDVGPGARVQAPTPTSSENINLMNYLNGDAQVAFPVVQKAVRERYHKKFANERELKKFLHETLRQSA